MFKLSPPFATVFFMKHRLHKYNAKTVRDLLNEAVEKSERIHRLEKELIVMLKEIDENRFYIRYGYKSLTGFCNFGLRFSRTQTYRIVTEVRRCQTTVNIGLKAEQESLNVFEDLLKLDQISY